MLRFTVVVPRAPLGSAALCACDDQGGGDRRSHRQGRAAARVARAALARSSEALLGLTWAWPANGDLHFELFSRTVGGLVGRELIRRLNLFVEVMVPLGHRMRRLPSAELDHYRAALPSRERRQASAVLTQAILGSLDFLAGVEAGLPALAHLPAVLVWGGSDPAFREAELARGSSSCRTPPSCGSPASGTTCRRTHRTTWPLRSARGGQTARRSSHDARAALRAGPSAGVAGAQRRAGQRLRPVPGRRVHRRSFIMLRRGALVAKLPQDRVDALVAAGTAERFDARGDAHAAAGCLGRPEPGGAAGAAPHAAARRPGGAGC